MTDKTLSDLLALPAGRQLDAEVVRTAGHELIRYYDGTLEIIVHGTPSLSEPIPDYSTDIAAAWPLLAEMLAGGEVIELRLGKALMLTRERLTSDDNTREFCDYVEVPTSSDAPLGIVRVWATWFYGKGEV